KFVVGSKYGICFSYSYLVSSGSGVFCYGAYPSELYPLLYRYRARGQLANKAIFPEKMISFGGEISHSPYRISTVASVKQVAGKIIQQCFQQGVLPC
ncbi:MAG: hypothetical protein D3903_19745, partial [Candidatus Electrothrix sp. GM3_4]|nr:hypothetical protein [Candidatus Electrothrix sp. GM3_4]